MLKTLWELVDYFTGAGTIIKGIIGSIIVVILLWFTFPYYTSETEVVTVNKTERITDGDESFYMIYTDKGEYKNVDQWRVLKWNSSELYGKLIIGKKYKIKSYGFRFKLLSIYPNITKAERITFVKKVKDKVVVTALDYAIEQTFK